MRKGHLTVILAEEEYKIQPLPLESMSEVVPTVLGLGKLEMLSQEQITKLARIAYLGAKTALPDLTYEDFLTLPITLNELMEAMPVVARQAGMKLMEKRPGEAPGATSPQITS